MTKSLRIFFVVAAGFLFGVLMFAQQSGSQPASQPASQPGSQPGATTPATANHSGPQTTTPPAPTQPAKPTRPAADPPPTIPPADRADFFKHQLALIQAQQAADRAQSAFQSVVQKLQKDCGEADGQYQPQIDAAGDPVCIVKAVSQPAPPLPLPPPAAPAKK